MKILIAEDDFTSRLLLQEILKNYGTCHVAVNGREAVTAACSARQANEPYDLICLDIMMPELDGHDALYQIRANEEEHGVISNHGSKIMMITALSDIKNVHEAYNNLCDGYLTKPIRKADLLDQLRQLKLIDEPLT